jgi:hypothetical protein
MRALVAADLYEMESTPNPPGSPTALQPVSSDRVNQQRDSMLSLRPAKDNVRDSIVSDKINQFNSLTMQSKQLERKTADAALKRAMLGREEAESEMRRYREEARLLRKQVDEGKERERRVGERLETVMVCRLALRVFLIMLTTVSPGKLRPRQRNPRAHSSAVGEGDPTRKERDIQVTERYSQAARRAKVSPVCSQDGRRATRHGKGAE